MDKIRQENQLSAEAEELINAILGECAARMPEEPNNFSACCTEDR